MLAGLMWTSIQALLLECGEWLERFVAERYHKDGSLILERRQVLQGGSGKPNFRRRHRRPTLGSRRFTGAVPVVFQGFPKRRDFLGLHDLNFS
jgi:hypothetical protein